MLASVVFPFTSAIKVCFRRRCFEGVDKPGKTREIKRRKEDVLMLWGNFQN
jgi:hypothetical protein